MRAGSAAQASGPYVRSNSGPRRRLPRSAPRPPAPWRDRPAWPLQSRGSRRQGRVQRRSPRPASRGRRRARPRVRPPRPRHAAPPGSRACPRYPRASPDFAATPEDFLVARHGSRLPSCPPHGRRAGRPSAWHDRVDDVLELAVHAAPLAHDAHEIRQAPAHLGREQRGLGARELARRKKEQPFAAREPLDLGDGGGADAAARRVYDALRAHSLSAGFTTSLRYAMTSRIFGAVEEAWCPPHDLVRHAGAQEHVPRGCATGRSCG